MDINYFTAFAYSFIASAAFAVLFQAPKKTLGVSGFIGAVGWVVFVYMKQDLGYSSYIANFSATVVLALLSELAARIFRQPATVYINPGIIPIVPGLGLYLGISQLIEKHNDQGMNTLVTAGLDAASIALGIMLVASIFRVLKMSKDRRFLAEILNIKKREGAKKI